MLKAERSSSAVKDAVVLDLGDLVRQAEKLQAAARAKAEAILVEAQAEAKRLIDGAEKLGHEAGHAKGLEQGIQEGREQGQAEAVREAQQAFESLQAQWTETLSGFDNERVETERQARAAVLQFALKLAEKIVHRQIEVDPACVEDQLAEAVSHVLRPTDVVIQTNPDDLPVVEAAMPRLVARFEQLQQVNLEADAEVKRGGCVVRYGQGRIDATLDTQLRRVVELLLPESPPPDSDDAGVEPDAGTGFAE